MSAVAVPVPPERTIEQRVVALARANDVRTARSTLKRDIKAGRRSASAIIVDTPDWAENMRVVELLMAVPRWGYVKANRAMHRIEISPAKYVGGLSPRQRRELLRWLHGR